MSYPSKFREVLETLARNNVRFVFIGGVAMRLHGSAYITRDTDISYARDPENFDALVAALSDHAPYLRGAPPGLPFHWDARTLKSTQNFTLITDIGLLDLLAVPDGVASFEELWDRSVTMELFEHTIHVASIDDLIAMKLAAGRDKDLGHVQELRALKELLASEE